MKNYAALPQAIFSTNGHRACLDIVLPGSVVMLSFFLLTRGVCAAKGVAAEKKLPIAKGSPGPRVHC